MKYFNPEYFYGKLIGELNALMDEQKKPPQQIATKQVELNFIAA